MCYYPHEDRIQASACAALAALADSHAHALVLRDAGAVDALEACKTSLKGLSAAGMEAEIALHALHTRLAAPPDEASESTDALPGQGQRLTLRQAAARTLELCDAVGVTVEFEWLPRGCQFEYSWLAEDQSQEAPEEG